MTAVFVDVVLLVSTFNLCSIETVAQLLLLLVCVCHITAEMWHWADDSCDCDDIQC